MSIKSHIWNMNLALEEAELAFKAGEVPVGAIIVDENDNVIARTHNLKEHQKDTTAHAEILAIREASEKLGDWRLLNCTIYITLEPCPMCLYAILQARFKNVVFGAYDQKAGSVSLGYSFQKDKRFNHKFSIIGGVEHFKCSKVLSDFFKLRRKTYRKRQS
ncbi:nucleoside deaminase [Halobacteriovorax sp. ZH4_bin.1]|uniref:nucleoside deaminase n=1 Tax=unclassified Halobacteriovorax TaxID=2639665 RepID=UPI003722D42A